MWPFGKNKRSAKVVQSQRAFAAAQLTNALHKWTKTSEQIDADLQEGGFALRARARDMAKNNVYAKKYLEILKTNVVGKDGIRLQARAKSRNSGQLDTTANGILEDRWAEFSMHGECDVTGKMSMIDAENLFITSEARDGEVLIREYHGYPNQFGYAIQFLDPDLLDERHNEDLSNGRYIRMGIEFNRNGFPVAYHLTPIRYDRVRGKNYRLNKRERVPASEIIHAYRPDFCNQSRGYTWMHAALLEMHHLGAFREAAIIAARIGASTMGFFTEKAPDDWQGDGSDATGNLLMDVEPGVLRKLPFGVDFSKFEATYPSDMVDAFEKRSLKGIASALNVSYNVLASDPESTSYGTLRGFTIDDRDYFRTLQSHTSAVFKNRIYRGWLANGLKNGSIGLREDLFQKFLDVRWQPRGWQWIDPIKDAAAFEKMLANNLTAPSIIAAEQGRDFEDVCQQISEDRKIMKKFGILSEEKTNVQS